MGEGCKYRHEEKRPRQSGEQHIDGRYYTRRARLRDKINERTRSAPKQKFRAILFEHIRASIRRSQGDPYLKSLSKLAGVLKRPRLKSGGALRNTYHMSLNFAFHGATFNSTLKILYQVPTSLLIGRAACCRTSKTLGMRSYPGIVARVLRENSSRGRTCPAKVFRSLTSTFTNHVAARAEQPQLASVQGVLLAAATRQGNTAGDHGSDALRRRWALGAVAATALALGVDDNKVVRKSESLD